MRILLAPDSFKGTLTAIEASEAMAAGVRRAAPEASITQVPVSDGGEGLLEVVGSGVSHARVDCSVSGPLGEPVQAGFLRFDLAGRKLALIESAQACGLSLIPESKRDPLRTSSRGVGELILEALGAGDERLVVGLGGSATVDGGAGLAQALGFDLVDGCGRALAPGGGQLHRLERIERSSSSARLDGLELIAACDVKNPLLGESGAALEFGPQKGADERAVARLEAGLERLARCFERDLGVRVDGLAGAGAAGGIGACLVAVCQARLESGAAWVLDLIDFDHKLADADLVLTGEGRADGQTAWGKAPLLVAKRAHKAGVPVALMAGSLGPGAENLKNEGFAWILSVDGSDSKAGTGQGRLPDAATRLADATSQFILSRPWS